MRTLCLVLCLLTLCGCANQPVAAPPAKAAANHLDWKCLWVWGLPRKTLQDAQHEVAISKSLGFNAIACDGKTQYMKLLMPEARKQGLLVYAVNGAPYGQWGFAKLGTIQAPPNCVQEFPPEELKAMSVQTDPDLPVNPGPWLCIDRPEARKYAADLSVAMLKEYGVDGIALDWTGYRNYRGCQCEYSRVERAKFAAAHPELSAEQVQKEFSLQRIELYYQAVRDAVLAENPKARLMCHIYPQFAAEPLYGWRLPVEHPAQTVAWFFKPHWPMQVVEQNCATVKQTEHKRYAYQVGTGFIGLDMAPEAVKTPDRLRQEIHAIKAAGLKGFCIAGGAEFLNDQGLSDVLSQELGGAAHLHPALVPAK